MTSTPPHNEDAERKIVGMLAVHPEWVRLVGDILEPAHFYIPAFGHLYDLIHGLWSDKPGAVTTELVIDRVKRRHDRQLSARLAEAIGSDGTTAYGTVELARLVARDARTRTLEELARQIAEANAAENYDRSAELTARLLEVNSSTPGGDSVTEMVDQWLDGDLSDEMLVSAGIDESWLFGDIDAILDGEFHPPRPTVLHFDGGEEERTRCLLYAGRINLMFGQSGQGKSMVALYATAQEIRRGRNVLWVDYEEPNAESVIYRLKALFGLSDGEIRAKLQFLGPTELWNPKVARLLERAYERYQWSLVVIDSLGEAFGVEGVGENNDNEVGPWLRQVPRIIAGWGPAVLLIDHATKAEENRLHPSGSKRKRAAVQGSAWLVHTTDPPDLSSGGKIILECAKDRHGFYRQGSRVGALNISDPQPGGRTVRLRRFLEGEEAQSTTTDWLHRKVLEVVRDVGPFTSDNSLGEALVRADVKVAKGRRGEMLAYFEEKGYVTREKDETNKTGSWATTFVRFPDSDLGRDQPQDMEDF